MGVYYKGYKLGTTTKLKIAEDFTKTYLYITLNQRGLHLPQNITAEVKNYDEDTKFVDLIYPKRPTLNYIKSGDVIWGKSKLNGLKSISGTNQAHIDNLSEKGEIFLCSATKTVNTLTDLFSLMTDILTENRENILISSKKLKVSMQNIEIITENLSERTKTLDAIGQNIDKASYDLTNIMPELNTLIKTGIVSLTKLNHILNGLGMTLQKRGGGMRVLFGVPIKE